MTAQSYFSSFRGKLTLLVIAATLLPLVISSMLLVALMHKQVNTIFENRLLAGAETFSLILENKKRDLTQGLIRIASDNTLQVTLDLDIEAQLRNYLTTQKDVLGFASLTVLGDKEANIDHLGNDLSICPVSDTSLTFSDHNDALLCQSRPIYQNDQLLGYVRGAISLSEENFLRVLQTKLVDKFIIWSGESLIASDVGIQAGRLSGLPSTIGVIDNVTINQIKYKMLTRQMSFSGENLNYGILLTTEEFSGSLRRILGLIGIINVFVFGTMIILLRQAIKDLIAPITVLNAAAIDFKQNMKRIPDLDYDRMDEFGLLNRTFRDMSISLNEYIEDIKDKNLTLQQFNERIERQNRELREWQETLEKKVATRTEDLLLSTKELQKEIAERKRTEEELHNSEEKLRQSQKMESIGRLAGGVAHDFNNILTGINGYAELILSSLPAGDPLIGDVEEIKKAADRAADLTQQLLAFSRKQVISPRIIQLNEVILQSQKMLGRIIGEDLQLNIDLAEDLWPVLADPGQIDQILINLAANARDATNSGGKLSIATANIFKADRFDAEHPDIKPGEHVVLTISDNGQGIDEETQQHIFEPFFSTKEQGKGTGLGLATVYGIVKQNFGYIYVYSKKGEGATFKIYFPHIQGQVDQKIDEVPQIIPPGAETVLLAEDETMVRNMSKKVLEFHGYRVIEAEDGVDACSKSDAFTGKIDLLLTDVVMPNMNGKELYERLHVSRPDMKVIFMSGYTGETIAKHGVLEEGTQFIQKPFTIDTLANKVREVLDL